MTATKRVHRVAVAAAVLSSGAFVAPVAASAAPSSGGVATDQVSASAGQLAAAKKRPRVVCRLKAGLVPKRGKKKLKSFSRINCNRKVKRVWTTVKLKQRAGKKRYPTRKKRTSLKNTRRNRAAQFTFCPRQVRTYKVIAKATVRLPKAAKRREFKFRKVIKQTGSCRVG